MGEGACTGSCTVSGKPCSCLSVFGNGVGGLIKSGCGGAEDERIAEMLRKKFAGERARGMCGSGVTLT